MLNRLYIVLVLSILVPVIGSSQTTKQETSLEKTEDYKSDIKKFDLINYQIIADQKYYKNNPDEFIKESRFSLDEQVSSKSADASADEKGVNNNKNPLDQSSSKSSVVEVAQHKKMGVSDADKSERSNAEINNKLEKEKKSNSNQSIDSKAVKQGEVVDKSISSNSIVKGLENQSNKNTTTGVRAKKEADSLIFNSKVVSNTKKETLNIELKEKTKVVQKEKYFRGPKIVEKSPVVIVQNISKPEIDREQLVVDELINSGNYDVYDDGKYIKFSKKKEIK